MRINELKDFQNIDILIENILSEDTWQQEPITDLVNETVRKFLKRRRSHRNRIGHL